MPAKYLILPELSLSVTKFSGEMNNSIILGAYQELTADKDFNIDLMRLTDCRDVTANNTTQGAIETLGRSMERESKVKRANLYSRTMEIGTFNQYRSYGSYADEDFLLTQDIDEALEWLGVSDSAEKIKSFLSTE